MKPEASKVVFAVRTAKGERRRIRSFLKQVQGLGVELDDLPPQSVRALNEADRFLGRYLDLLAKETPNTEQLEGVIEALGGIDRVVKNAMAEVLKSLGWRPDSAEQAEEEGRSRRRSLGLPDPIAARKRPADQAEAGKPTPRLRRPGAGAAGRPAMSKKAADLAAPSKGGKVITFPGPGYRRPRSS